MMVFRVAETSDIGGIQVVRRSVRENRLSDPGSVTDKDCEEFLTLRGRGWVCQIDGDIAGFAIADLKENNVWALFVKPEYEGKGIGQKLQRLMLDWYFCQTPQKIGLSTTQGTRAEFFYEKSGWTKAGVAPNGEMTFEITLDAWAKIKLDFSRDYILENEAAILRPLVSGDFDNLVHFLRNEPEIWKYSYLRPQNEQQFRAYIETALEGRLQEKEYPFIVFDKRANAYAGSTRFYDIQRLNGATQLGFTWYGSQFQGTGLNKHCKFLLLDFAFETMQCERVEFRADNNNSRSIAAMGSIGCVAEGVLRSHGLKSDGSRRVSIVLSILKTEWENGGKEKLQQKIAQR